MTEQFAAALTDLRSQPSVVHTLREMVRMRVFGILADYRPLGSRLAIRFIGL